MADPRLGRRMQDPERPRAGFRPTPPRQMGLSSPPPPKLGDYLQAMFGRQIDTARQAYSGARAVTLGVSNAVSSATAAAGRYGWDRYTDPVGSVRGAPAAYSQFEAGVGETLGKSVAGGLNMAGQIPLPGYQKLGEAGDRFNAAIDERVARYAEPSTPVQHAMRLGGQMAPYFVAPGMAARGAPTLGAALTRGAAADFVVDATTGASSYDYSMVGASEQLNPEGKLGRAAEAYAERLGGREALRENDALRGIADALPFGLLAAAPSVLRGAAKLDNRGAVVNPVGGGAPPDPELRTFDGRQGDSGHLTGKQEGELPTSVVAELAGLSGEVRGAHRNRQGDRWTEFTSDIAENGIRDPIFITVDYDGRPAISEGNHRIDAAVELGLESVPVEVRYFGQAEQQGTVLGRASRSTDAPTGPSGAIDAPVVAEAGVNFSEGERVSFRFIRNTESAPDMGSRFQQDIEPAGRYLQHDTGAARRPEGSLPDNMETGELTFERPLMIPFNPADGNSYNKTSWKAVLSERYGGMTGRELSQAVVDDGYDGVVTVGRQGNTSEIVDLTWLASGRSIDAPTRVPGQVDNGMSGKWFSRLEGAIESAPQPRATARQWAGMIRKAQGGVGRTELEWTGIERLLEDAGDRVLTKDEVLAMARENPINLTEEVFGTPDANPFIARKEEAARRLVAQGVATPDQAEAIALAVGEGYGAEMAISRAGVTSPSPALIEAVEQSRAGIAEGFAGTLNTPSFSKWTQGEWGLNPEANSREIRVMLDGSDYVPNSSHNTPAGEIVRLRTTDRQVNGENTLFLEEIQSDWHQKGRKEGYQGSIPRRQGPRPHSEMDMAWALERQEDAYRALNDHVGRYYGDQDPGVNRSERRVELSEERDAASAAYTEMLDANREWRGPTIEPGVPDAPFKKTDEWTGLAVRRAIQEAAQGGYERLAWVSGEQAADLYDLRKQVSRIEYDEATGALDAYGLDGTSRPVAERGVTPEQLEGFIGKEPARRLMEQEPTLPSIVKERNAFQEEMAATHGMPPRPDHRPALNDWWEDLRGRMTPEQAAHEKDLAAAAISEAAGGYPRRTPNRRIEGDDLAVGGEGMDTFYNRVVPKAVQKELKRYGLEIEPVSLSEWKMGQGLPDGFHFEGGYGTSELVDDATGRVVGSGAGQEEAFQSALAQGAINSEPTNLSIRIPPEARERILADGMKIAGGAGLLGAQMRRKQEQESKPRLGQRLQGTR